MNNRSFLVWISALAVPVVSLIAVQIDTNSGASIGGGGYDLGPFLYSWLLIMDGFDPAVFGKSNFINILARLPEKVPTRGKMRTQLSIKNNIGKRSTRLGTEYR